MHELPVTQGILSVAIEAAVVQSARLPLNLEHNEKEPFREILSSLRREMRRRAIHSEPREESS